MLKLKSDLLKINRMEKSASTWVLEHAVTGTWVAPAADGVGQPAAGAYAFPIFTESNRDGSVGFTGDVAITGNVTVLYGKFEAVTDQYVGTPAVGDKLYVNADGKLANETAMSFADDAAKAAANVVAVCTKAPYSTTYMGRSVQVIEYVTK